MAVTPVTVVNLSAGTPAQTQGYPYYFPEYYPGYDPYNSWDWGWVTHGAGDGLSEFPSDLADVGTAGSAVAFSVQASDTSALVTLASCIRGSDTSALPMRVLVAGPAAAVADSMIKPATFRGDPDGSLGKRPHLVGPRWVSAARRTPVQTQTKVC
jgi:hypothetical protein